MSTRCRIGILNKDKSVTSIYCHCDGYLTGVGKMLVDNYQDVNKINELMELGNLSSLGKNPIQKPEKKQSDIKNINEWFEKMFASFDDPTRYDYCDSYKAWGRDEEEWKPLVESLEETIEDFRDSDCEYLYLFKNNKWYYYVGYESKKWDLVEPKVRNKELYA